MTGNPINFVGKAGGVGGGGCLQWWVLLLVYKKFKPRPGMFMSKTSLDKGNCMFFAPLCTQPITQALHANLQHGK